MPSHVRDTLNHTTSIHLKQTLDKPHKIKSVNGLNINAQDIGAEKPIVFIHRLPVNHKVFEYQFTELT
jgi:hypothetical protein